MAVGSKETTSVMYALMPDEILQTEILLVVLQKLFELTNGSGRGLCGK